MESTMESTTESIMETMENKSNNIWKWLLIFCLMGALVFAIILAVQNYNQRRAEKQFEKLAEQTKQIEQTEITDDSQFKETADSRPVDESMEEQENVAPEKDYENLLKQKGVPILDKEVDFAELTANINADIYAWIYIPDTEIDYPVLQHPTDNSYYLNYNLDGSKGYPGCIYSEDYNTKDFSDPNTVLYGHNMKNGTMFAGLHKYADMDYLMEHPYVYIYTPERLYVYEIYAAYEYSNAHLLLNYDFDNKVFFGEYLDEIRELRSMNHNIKDDVEVTTEDNILTLSTCITNKPNNRYLVQGVLLNED